MPDPLPLPARLSAALIALTIEVDNAAEQQIPHVTTLRGLSGSRGGVWLTSLAMWFNCLGPLADAGGELSAAALRARARMATNLDGMRRWGYISIDGIGRVPRRHGDAGRPRPKTGSILTLTERGAVAESVWRPLPAVVERRWRDRFGDSAVDRLRAALLAVAAADPARWPDFMPILSVRDSRLEEPDRRDSGTRAEDATLTLVSLLARALLRFTCDYDRSGRLPLGMWANLVRVLDSEEGIAARVLPAKTGVSKEALAMMVGVLAKTGVVIVEPVPGSGQGRQLRLTAERGVRARAAGASQVSETTTQWQRAFGAAVVPELLAALDPIVGDGCREGSPLFAGLDPASDAWRAQGAPQQVLPWYPLVLHRGGYPDGS